MIKSKEARRVREPSLSDAVLPLVTLAVLIGGSLYLPGSSTGWSGR